MHSTAATSLHECTAIYSGADGGLVQRKVDGKIIKKRKNRQAQSNVDDIRKIVNLKYNRLIL